MISHVKITTLPSFIDLICPYKCYGCHRIGSPLCSCCKNYNIAKNPSFSRLLSLNSGTTSQPSTLPDSLPLYIAGLRDGLLSRLIIEYKYHSVRGLAAPLAEILTHVIPDINPAPIIVPLPTISKHIRARGFDHTQLLAKHLSQIKSWSYQPLLTRVNNTVQVGSSNSDRIKQANSAYALSSNIHLDPDTPYLLLDDIYTTGASLRAAANILLQNGAKNIHLAVLATSNLPEEPTQ